jgi:hypothetical protein
MSTEIIGAPNQFALLVAVRTPTAIAASSMVTLFPSNPWSVAIAARSSIASGLVLA